MNIALHGKTIAIEGIDGSGKTTIATELAKRLGVEYIKDPAKSVFGMSSAEYKELFNSVEKKQNHSTIAQLLSMGYTSINNIDGCVCDRHILSNFFYNGNDDTIHYFDAQVQAGDVPDLTIVLFCGQEERIRRIRERNPEDPDLKKDQKVLEANYNKMMTYAASRGIPCMEVSSEFVPKDDLVRTLADIVVEYCQKIDEYQSDYGETASIFIKSRWAKRAEKAFDRRLEEYLGNFHYRTYDMNGNPRIIDEASL